MLLYSSKLIDTVILRLLAFSLNTRRMLYAGAFSTTNPFRTGPVGMVVGFLAEIHPLSLVAAMPGETSRTLCSVVSHALSCGKEIF